jgi:hypothetical protein
MKDRFWLGLGLGALLMVGGAMAFRGLGPQSAAAKSPSTSGASDRGGLVASFGVGGVLTRDGELWQYRPDRDKWVTLDESFGLEGTTTKLIPLPVPADQVKMMETFGFLITQSDECWLYDLDKNEWKNIGAPPFHDLGR